MVSTALLEDLLNTSSSSESDSSDEEWLACLGQFDKLDQPKVNNYVEVVKAYSNDQVNVGAIL